MTFKDLENEGWIKFEGCDDLNAEIPKKELCKILLRSYHDHLKYNHGKVDEKLKERYDKLDDILRPLNEITVILYLKNAKLKSKSNIDEYNDFLMVKVKEETEILLNITTGEDLSINYNNVVEVIDNVTEVRRLYTFNPKNYQDDLEIGKIESVILYKNVDIQNSVNYNTVRRETDIIEIKDIKGNVFYLDTLLNDIYKRKNVYCLRKSDDTKMHILFKNGLENKFDLKLFNNLKFKIMSMFFDFI